MYEDFYKLTGKPFQLSPDPSFFFGSKGHSKAYAYLKYGVYQGEGFIVISGEIGAGKTTLVRALLEELDHEKVHAVQLVSTQLEADDLLRAVSTAFGLSGKGDKAQMLVEMESYLQQLRSDGKRALLMVDEAQNLSPRAMEELRMLSNFQYNEHALLQSFLVGQPELRTILRSPNLTQLRQRILTSYHLGPMEPNETRAYIEHRLSHVGWDNDPVIHEDVWKPVHEATEGLPRKINTLFNRLMLSAFLGEKHEISLADVKLVVSEFANELTMSNAAPADPKEAVVEPAMAGAGLNGHAGPVGERGGAGRNSLNSALSARLDRLETKVDALLELARGGAAGTQTSDTRPQVRSRFARGIPSRNS
jgi:putative secretion ATPase (PEP-CTERM system associated)